MVAVGSKCTLTVNHEIGVTLNASKLRLRKKSFWEKRKFMKEEEIRGTRLYNLQNT